MSSPYTTDAPRCPLCAGAMRLRWDASGPDREGTSPESFRMWWCDRSQFGQILPRPEPERSIALHDARFFGDVSSKTPAPEDDPSGLARLRIRLAHRLDRSRPLSPESVHELVGRRPAAICDVGCGNGEVLEGLRNLGHDVTGVEPAPVARRNAAARGLRIVDTTAEQLGGVPRDFFDVVIARHSLEHCSDPFLAFRNLVSIVKPGGRLVCAVPNCDSLGFRISGPTWWHSDLPRHLSFFTERALRELCAANGLSVEHVEHYGFVRQFTPAWINWERKLWDRRFTGARGAWVPRRPGGAENWLRLARVLFANARQRYDSVKVIAVRPAQRRIAA